MMNADAMALGESNAKHKSWVVAKCAQVVLVVRLAGVAG